MDVARVNSYLLEQHQSDYPDIKFFDALDGFIIVMESDEESPSTHLLLMGNNVLHAWIEEDGNITGITRYGGNDEEEILDAFLHSMGMDFEEEDGSMYSERYD
jgi:hypothetical protein